MSIHVGNDDYIISCNFGGSIMSGFAVIEGVGGGSELRKQKRLVLLGLSVLKQAFLR